MRAPQGRQNDEAAQASARERQAFWQDVPERERMRRWEAGWNQVLAEFAADPDNRDGLSVLQHILRTHEGQPLASVEVSARALYTTFFAQDGQADPAAFVRRVMQTTTRAQREAHAELIAGLAKVYGPESAREAMRRLWERHTATVLGTDAHTDEEVVVPARPRPHVTIVGNTGSGKSTLIKSMIADLFSRSDGPGVLVLDPHDGSLVNDVLGLVPQERLGDVVYLSLTETTTPFSLNIFACEDAGSITEAGQVASFVLHLFETLFFSSGGLASAPQFSQVMRAISRTLIANRLTMAEIPLLLTDEVVREKLTANLTNPQVRLFWEEYNRKTPRERWEWTASSTNKIDSYLSEPLIARIVSQRSTIPWRRLMDERRIVLISLSRQFEEASRVIGATILGQCLMASFSRMASPGCPEFHVFCDEWQSLVTSDFATWIHEARKGRCVLHMANQSLSQLSELNRQAALSAGALVVFRVGSPEDAKTLAASLEHTPEPEIRAPVVDVVGHLLHRGHSHPAIAAFVHEYLQPLEALLRKEGISQFAFEFGCAILTPGDLIEGQRLLNEALAEANRTGRAEVFVDPLALFILGGASNREMTRFFAPHFRPAEISLLAGTATLNFQGLLVSANAYGRPGFRTEEALARFLASYTRPSWWDRLWRRTRQIPPSVTAFVRLLRSLREVLETLARQHLTVETGEQPPEFRPKSFADAENMVAMELSRMENYKARVKLPSGEEHLIRTHPAPQGVSGRELAARLRLVKARMLELGFCREALEVDKEVAERHEALRRPPEEPPPRRRAPERPPRRTG